MGEARLAALIQESLAVATRTEALQPKDLARVVVDTTVQPNAVMFPTDAKLLNRARDSLVRLAARVGVELRQSYVRVGKLALIKYSTLRPCPSVQARQQGLAQAQDLSWPRDP
jgi:IS5 family transposase